MRKVILLFIFNFLTFPALAQNPLQILNNYQQAVKYFEHHDYDKASELFTLVKQHMPVDGELIIRYKIQQVTRSQGRRVEKIQQKKPVAVYIKPNEYLSRITKIKLDIARRGNPPHLEIKWLALRDLTRDNILEGGESGFIVLQIINSGKSKALDVMLKLKSNDKDIVIQRQIPIGHIDANSERLSEIPIKAAKNISAKTIKLEFIAQERDGFDSNSLEVTFQTLAHRPPKLAITKTVINDLDGNKKINPREVIEIHTTVSNIGQGLANNVRAELIIGSKNIFEAPENKKLQLLGSLAPKESKTVKYSIITNTRIRHGAHLPVAVKLTELENKDQYGGLQNINLVMHNQSKETIPIKPKKASDGKQFKINDIATYIPKTTQFNNDAVGVVIGNSEYSQSGLPKVDYAVNDARLVKTYLLKSLGYRERNIIYLEDATTGKFQETFGNKDNIAGKLNDFIIPNKSDVFIYYSGHGAPNQKDKGAYFVPTDANPNYIATSGYALKTLYNNLAKMPIRNIIIVLDTCFSGNSPNGPIYPKTSPAILVSPDLNTPLIKMRNAIVFTSATNKQMSSWYPEKKHSLFTYYFLKGLGGAADKNKDQRLLSSELYNYLSQQVPYMAKRLSGIEQTPGILQDKDRMIMDYSVLASN